MWIIVYRYEWIGYWIIWQCFIRFSLAYLRNLWSCDEFADSTFCAELGISFIDQISSIFFRTFIAFFILLDIAFIGQIESWALVWGCIRWNFWWLSIDLVNTAISLGSSWFLLWFLRYLWNISHPIAATVIILKMWHLLIFCDSLTVFVLFILNPVNFIDLNRKRINVIVFLFQKITYWTYIVLIVVLWVSSRSTVCVNSWWSWLILLSLSYIVLFVDPMRRSSRHRRSVLINKWNFRLILIGHYFSLTRRQIHF